jgi:hypothetical protein
MRKFEGDRNHRACRNDRARARHEIGTRKQVRSSLAESDLRGLRGMGREGGPADNVPTTPALKLKGGLATPAGLEPATCRLEGGCSIQLSYGAEIPGN